MTAAAVEETTAVEAPVRRRRVFWRVAAGALILALGLIGVWVLAGDPTPPDPVVCDRLEAQALAEQDITVIYEMDRMGCEDPPYDAVRWP